MRIESVHIKEFKRFHDLCIKDIPEQSRLVILAGPNGCGKSSLFDAFSYSHYTSSGRNSWDGMWDYYIRPGSINTEIGQKISIDFHAVVDRQKKSNFYFRSAYRQEADFTLKTLAQMGDPTAEENQVRKMIATDVSVSKNYQRLASQALQDAFANADETMTLAQFRERVIGELRRTIKVLFPDLDLNSLGNPLEQGTFCFDKGKSKGFKYKNLSGGEKAAFDLILDIIVKRNSFKGAIYCIDEPELHMNTRLQGDLLKAILDVIPEDGQLWISTHSIGMMRKAQHLWRSNPLSVTFLDFGNINPDAVSLVTPSKPTRQFWENVLAVALDDLADLVAPSLVVICEGNPANAVSGKNNQFDATCYNIIFKEEKSDVTFISSGNSSSVVSDRLGLVGAIPLIVKGTVVMQLIDRDDHTQQDVDGFYRAGISVLSRRQIESYLYDDEILGLLCQSVGQAEKQDEIIAAKTKALLESVDRGNPTDDMKSAAGSMYVSIKKILKLNNAGNDQHSFAKYILSPLIKDGGRTYEELKTSIFTSRRD